MVFPSLEETNTEPEEMESESTLTVSPETKKREKYTIHFPGAVKRRAYRFDGQGNFFNKEWDLSEGQGREFCWYHVELPRSNQKLALAAQYLIDVLCPPLKLHDILALVSNGPFIGNVDGAVVFRVNSAGPTGSKFTHRLAARVTENTVITVSLGKVPRLGFSPTGQSLLSEIPIVESPNYGRGEGSNKSGSGTAESNGIVIREHVLEFLLTMNHSEEADNPVPTRISNLLVHIIDTHVDHLQDIVTKLEMDLDATEIELDNGGYILKKQMLDDRRFPKMHLNLQRLLQVIAHGEQVFPRVKDKCTSKPWFALEDIGALEVLVGRLRRLKESVGFIANRVTAIQAGLDSWQAEQINRKLYYLSFLSMIFLPLSIVTGIFGMNVGGVPWTEQKNPALRDGFINVLLICAAILLLLLVCFGAIPVYTRLSAWRKRQASKKIWSSTRRSFTKRGNYSGETHNGGYLLL
uniref:Magnesium transporter n=1 Tax=Araucaria cunninghamii TaxID=56994 RepID=A0A0D6R3F3_ARACU